MAWDWMPQQKVGFGEDVWSDAAEITKSAKGAGMDAMKPQAKPPPAGSPPPATNADSFFAKALHDPMSMAKEMFFNPKAVEEIAREGAPAAKSVVDAATPAAQVFAQAAQPAVQQVMAEADKARAASLWQSIPVTAKLAAGAAVAILVGRKLIKFKR